MKNQITKEDVLREQKTIVYYFYRASVIANKNRIHALIRHSELIYDVSVDAKSTAGCVKIDLACIEIGLKFQI